MATRTPSGRLVPGAFEIAEIPPASPGGVATQAEVISGRGGYVTLAPIGSDKTFTARDASAHSLAREAERQGAVPRPRYDAIPTWPSPEPQLRGSKRSKR